MEITKGFYDFCVPYQQDLKKLKSIVAELLELGYRTIAIEQTYDHSIVPKKEGGQRKTGGDIFPTPVNLEFLDEFKSKLKILQRLTIIYADDKITHPMTTSSNLKKFNIIAGLPKNENALNHCCTTFNGDILCFSPDEGNRLLIQRKPYQVASKRGIFFELKYSDAITNSAIRRDMIKLAHNYHTKGKSKNIIFSSGAKSIFELRSPYDIANLALIFGLSEEQGKSSVSSICKQLYLKAECRRLGKTVMFGKNILLEYSSSSEKESDMESDCDEQMLMEEDSELIEQPVKKKKLN